MYKHKSNLFQTALVYQLQRRVRTLREQVQRKDLHLDLLRRKLALQEDNTKVKTILQSERDEAALRVKKLLKQVDRLQLQLAEAKSQIRDLNAQLAEAADYKVTHPAKGRANICFNPQFRLQLLNGVGKSKSYKNV